MYIGLVRLYYIAVLVFPDTSWPSVLLSALFWSLPILYIFYVGIALAGSVHCTGVQCASVYTIFMCNVLSPARFWHAVYNVHVFALLWLQEQESTTSELHTVLLKLLHMCTHCSMLLSTGRVRYTLKRTVYTLSCEILTVKIWRRSRVICYSWGTGTFKDTHHFEQKAMSSFLYLKLKTKEFPHILIVHTIFLTIIGCLERRWGGGGGGWQRVRV